MTAKQLKNILSKYHPDTEIVILNKERMFVQSISDFYLSDKNGISDDSLMCD